MWKILEFQPKINIVSHSRSPQNLIESVEDLENPTTINRLNHSRSRQFSENVWELETISRCRKTIFRKFAWKNFIFEPNLTAIHLIVIHFPEHTIFSKIIVRDGDFSSKSQFYIHFWQHFLLLSHSQPFLSLAQAGNIYYGFVKNFKHMDFWSQRLISDMEVYLNKIPLKRDASGPEGYSDTSGLDWNLCIV